MDPNPQSARKRPRVREALRIAARLGAWLGLFGTLLAAIGLLAIVATVWWFGRAADDIDLAPLLDYQPAQVTRVLARDGTPIGEIAIQRRTVVGWDALPQSLIDAFVAAEDADFFDHAGLDWSGIARATLSNLVHGEARQGASTITQQVIKNTLLGSARTLERKSQELRLVARVEALLDKREIFTIYVNEIYLGEGCHGVEQAARHYFGKSVTELDLGEAAVLAVLPRSPGSVTPYRQGALLEARRKHVIGRMIRLGSITADEARPFLVPPKILDRDAPRDRAAFGDADEFVALARRELVRRYGEDRLATLGATVRTTVDLEVQRAARAGGRAELDALERRHGHGGHARALAAKARARLFARAPEQLALGESQTVVVVSNAHVHAGWLDAELGRHRVRVELPARARTGDRFPIAGALRVTIIDATSEPLRAALEPGPELALALADVHTGELRALIGGREFALADFDRSRAALRQPGSAFKPILYGAALRSGRFTAASRGHGGPQGQPMRLREALAQSDNPVALALFDAIGPDAVHEFARDLGLTRTLGRQPSLALGTSEVTPLELLTCYLTLARSGAGIEPHGVLSIEVPGDLSTTTHARVFGVEAEVAALLTSMLRSVVDEGTGKLAAELGRPVAGKTGTTDDARDAWFAGYTPDHVAVVWVGFDLPRSLGKLESGGELALAIWLAAMAAAERDLPVREFDRPPGLARARIDRETGGLACRSRASGLECSDPARWVDELFIPGTAPGEREDSPFGPKPSRPDPHERGAPPPRHTEVALTSVRLFVDDPGRVDADSLRPPLAERRRAIETSWQRMLARERSGRTHSVGARVGLRVRVKADGEIAGMRIAESSGDTWLDARAEAALREGLVPSEMAPLPELLFDPLDRQAELGFELIAGEPLDQARP